MSDDIFEKDRVDVNDLNKLYHDSETSDRKVFSDMRSNILLVAGDHYARKNQNYWNRLRENKYLSQEQKVRLTKNHVQRITKNYVNNIISHSPGVAILPNNEKETADRKAAELNNSVWEDAKKTYKLKDHILKWATDYIEMGECAVKIFWNPDKGEFKGYQPVVDPMTGQPVIDPQTGQPVQDPNNPIFAGEFEFERIFAFNLLRAKGADSLEESPFLAVRKMVPVNKVKGWVRNDKDKAKKITASSDQTFYVFEAAKNGYDKSKDHALVVEWYFRPCRKYPRGYYYIATREVILFEGELPFGIWPIRTCGFDEIQTSPRHRSIIKQLRPYQIEINRAASKIAEHQVTLGDDKLLVQSGTKITDGVNLPGVRSLQYTGRDPVILQGRSGEQYVNYMSSQIEEMYAVANMREDIESTPSSQHSNDPFGQLFKSLRDKKKFAIYAEKFERFLMEVCDLYLNLARFYYEEDRLIPMVGKNEWVNVSEFKNTTPLTYQIKLEPRTDDINTMMGKHLVMSQILQYSGSSLEREDIGKIIRNMPFANADESFGDLTVDYDSGTNMILALDRGEQYEPNFYDNHKYMLKRLLHRVRMPDFKLLDPQIQQYYQQTIQVYEQMEVRQQELLLAAQNEFIPTGGAMVKVDYYVPKPGDPTKSERALLPAEAVDWLIKRMADQGSAQEQLKGMSQGGLQDMAQQLLAQRQGATQ